MLPSVPPAQWMSRTCSTSVIPWPPLPDRNLQPNSFLTTEIKSSPFQTCILLWVKLMWFIIILEHQTQFVLFVQIKIDGPSFPSLELFQALRALVDGWIPSAFLFSLLSSECLAQSNQMFNTSFVEWMSNGGCLSILTECLVQAPNCVTL